jgi:hypothetical protein
VFDGYTYLLYRCAIGIYNRFKGINTYIINKQPTYFASSAQSTLI